MSSSELRKDLASDFSALKQEIDWLAQQRPNSAIDDIFVYWFVMANLTEDQDKAFNSICGSPGDKQVDYLLIDEDLETVFIGQGKYRTHLLKVHEKASEMKSFGDLARTISTDDDSEFRQFVSKADPMVGAQLRKARERIKNRGYAVKLAFFSTGKISPQARQAAQQLVRLACANASIEVFDGKQVLRLFRDYVDGVAPPIPTLDLPLEAGTGTKVNGILQRYDADNKIESWALSMRGDQVGALFRSAGRRLFARNIRGFLGRTQINKEMETTLQEKPERFFYYNNGLTLMCDQAEKISERGTDVLRVSNPQVINGQQTTLVLAQAKSQAKNASVLVKVIRLDPHSRRSRKDFDSLISSIVRATNSQNSIRPADLMSNDPLQVHIERELRKLGYFYIRKRQSKSEIRRIAPGKYKGLIKKEDLAQAVAGCDLDPVVPRSGKDALFTEAYYGRIFTTDSSWPYLAKYLLLHEVTWHAKGYPQRGYAKWLVLGFIWSHFLDDFEDENVLKRFVKLIEDKESRLLSPLSEMINTSFDMALSYYRKNAGRGSAAQDISQFFRSKRGRDLEFARFWKGCSGPRRKKFNRNRSAIAALLS